MSEHKLRILHISDVHFRGEREREAWRRSQVLGPAWDKNLDELLADGAIDLVCLTGDIANTGKADEYQQASDFVRALLQRLGLDPSRIFVVPGNHDIDRSLSKSAWNALRRHLPKADSLDVARWFAGGSCPSVRGLRDSHRDAILQRQKAFRDWIRDQLSRPDLLPENSPHKLLGYRSTLNLSGYPFPIQVIGLDSAWLAGDDHDVENLRLTDDQVMRLAADPDGNPLPGLKIALVHHPLHNLADHTTSQQLLADKIDLLLRGHMHEQDAVQELRPDQTLCQLAAGCLYEGSRANAYANACQLIELTLDPTGRPRQLDLRFRSWSTHGHWHDDPSRYKDAPEGRLRWILERTASEDRWITSSASAQAPVTRAGTLSYESLLGGMRTLESGRRVRNFFAGYLGTPEHPEPFGGRAVELAALHHWLDAAGPPCLVLAAPAGCGKSALLCRFCIDLLPRTDLAVVFFPVSIRYQTNLESSCIPAIVASLCHLHGQPIPKLEHTSATQWRLLLDQYLCQPLPDGRMLLLIVDGLDEADDWQVDRSFLPTQLPSRVRILVSARYRAGDTDADRWRQLLGWGSPMRSQGLVLSGLDVNGVAQAIASLGMPLDKLGDRSELVVQIHRLSRGEPLLVQMWCHHLWRQGENAIRLTPAQLGGYPDGFKGYMQVFWEARKQTASLRQRANAQLVLEILASAFGPLGREELLEVAPEIGSLSAMQDALEPLSRFVIGDGNTQGYVLSHSLLRDYFRDEMMTAAERQERGRRFLSYGQKTLTALADTSPGDHAVPGYLLRYYGSHLQNGNSPPDDYLQLVSDSWRLAWQKTENGAAGFLHDVNRAWDAVDREEAQRVSQGKLPRRLGAMVRCAMCVASVQSILNGIYYQLPILLVEKQIWSVGQALAYVQQMSGERHSSSSRNTILHFLLPRLPDALLPRLLDILLDQANSTYGAVDELLMLSERLAKSCPHEAIATARGIRTEVWRSRVLASLARYLPPERGATLCAEALTLARACPDAFGKSAWLQALCQYLPSPQKEEALKESAAAARLVENVEHRASRWHSLVPLLPKRSRARITALESLFDAACQSDPEKTTLPQALETLDGFSLPTQKRILRKVLLLPHGKAAIMHWVFSHHRLQVLGEPIPQPRTKWRMIQALVSSDDIAALIQPTVDGLHSDEPWHFLESLTQLGPFLSSQQKNATVALLQTAPNPWLAARGLCLLAPYLDHKWRLEGLSRLVSLEWRTDYSGYRDLHIVVSALDEEQLDAAATIVRTAVCAPGMAWACFILAPRQQGDSQVMLLAQAKDAALQITSREKRARLLRDMLSYYPGEQQRELLANAYQAICSIRSAWSRIHELTQLAQGLNQPFLDGILRLALDEVPKLEPHYGAAGVLENILKTSGISDELSGQVLAEALHAARGSRSAREREFHLTDLSRLAPAERQPAILLEALAASQRLDDRISQIRTIAKLEPDESMQRRLLTLCDELEPEVRLQALYEGLWPHAEPFLRPAVVSAGLAAARALPSDNPSRVSYLVNWMARLSETDRPTLAREALAEARRWLDEHREFLWHTKHADDKDEARVSHDVARVLLYALPILFGELGAEDVLATNELVPPSWTVVRAAVLPRVAEPLKSELTRRYLSEARSQPDHDRGLALARLVIHLDPQARAAGIQEALHEARIVYTSANTYFDNRDPVLRCVAPYLQAEHLPRFNKLLTEIHQQENCPFMSTGTLLDAIPEGLRGAVIDNLIERMQPWPVHVQDRVLAACADRLPMDWHERLAAGLPRLFDQWNYRPLAALVPKLTARLLRQILAATLTANGALAPTDAQLHALAMVGAELLRRSPSAVSEVVPVIMAMLRRRVENRQTLLTALDHLAPLLRLLVGKAGMTEISETILEVGTWWL